MTGAGWTGVFIMPHSIIHKYKKLSIPSDIFLQLSAFILGDCLKQRGITTTTKLPSLNCISLFCEVLVGSSFNYLAILCFTSLVLQDVNALAKSTFTFRLRLMACCIGIHCLLLKVAYGASQRQSVSAKSKIKASQQIYTYNMNHVFFFPHKIKNELRRSAAQLFGRYAHGCIKTPPFASASRSHLP